MDMYDPEKKIGLIIGEWGCWHQVEEGTNPGFLYQQNTMRDAIVAAVELNVFNKHSDRVVMANLAQAVNVLQALILTEGEKMVKTPTYHVFDLFKTHQGGELCYSYADNCQAGGKIPMISQSASVKDGVLTVTIANCSIDDDAHICCDIAGANYQNIECKILDNDVRDYNDFDNCNKVAPKEYSAKMTDKGFEIDLPKCSVAVVTMK